MLTDMNVVNAKTRCGEQRGGAGFGKTPGLRFERVVEC